MFRSPLLAHVFRLPGLCVELVPGGGDMAVGFLLLKAVSGEEDGSFYNSMAAAARLGGLELEECDVLFFDIDGSHETSRSALFVITLVVASIYIHLERLGGVKADLADAADAADPAALATVEITQAAPHPPTHSHPHP